MLGAQMVPRGLAGRGLAVLAALAVLSALSGASARHMFFRSLGPRPDTRRVFGGNEARAGAYPGACALLDHWRATSCSCSVVAPRWALTAAHCAKRTLGFVQYNGGGRADSRLAQVAVVYAHPAFEAVVKDQGAGPDVVLLQHDVGLVRTRADMRLSSFAYFPRPMAPRASADGDFVRGMLLYDVADLQNEDIDILGFGMTDAKPAGERLREVRLRLASCWREHWRHCSCAVGAASGVCSGDSGGPVLYNSTQIGVMSMGPIECGRPAPLGGRALERAVSVFTELRPYAALINATIYDVDSALRMREVARNGDEPARSPVHAALCAASLLLCRSF